MHVLHWSLRHCSLDVKILLKKIILNYLIRTILCIHLEKWTYKNKLGVREMAQWLRNTCCAAVRTWIRILSTHRTNQMCSNNAPVTAVDRDGRISEACCPDWQKTNNKPTQLMSPFKFQERCLPQRSRAEEWGVRGDTRALSASTLCMCKYIYTCIHHFPH